MGGFYRTRTLTDFHGRARTSRTSVIVRGCLCSSVSVRATRPLLPGPAALAHLLEHQLLLARGVGHPELVRQQPELPPAHGLAQGQGLHAIARILGGAGPALAGAAEIDRAGGPDLGGRELVG